MKNESCVRWKSWDCGPYCFHYWSLCNDSALSSSDSFSVSLTHSLNIVDRPMNSIISFSSAFSYFFSPSVITQFSHPFNLGCLPAWLPASRDRHFQIILISIPHSHTFFELMNFFVPLMKIAKASFSFLEIYFFVQTTEQLRVLQPLFILIHSRCTWTSHTFRLRRFQIFWGYIRIKNYEKSSLFVI